MDWLKATIPKSSTNPTAFTLGPRMTIALLPSGAISILWFELDSETHMPSIGCTSDPRAGTARARGGAVERGGVVITAGGSLSAPGGPAEDARDVGTRMLRLNTAV